MNIKIDTIALIGAGTVAAGTVLGSAASLNTIGEHAGLVAAWSLPLAIDVSAMVAGLARRADRRNVFALLVLLGMTAVSAGLQWYETGTPIAALVPLGALLTFELAMHMLPESLDVEQPEAKPLTRRQSLDLQARELNIPRRSKMNVEQLDAAVAKARRAQLRSA